MELMTPQQIMSAYAVGSDDHSWTDELLWIIAHHTQKFVALIEDVTKNGVTEPVMLGNDGRVWDGHHRICAAWTVSSAYGWAMNIPVDVID